MKKLLAVAGLALALATASPAFAEIVCAESCQSDAAKATREAKEFETSREPAARSAGSNSSTTEIYAVFICHYYKDPKWAAASGCRPPDRPPPGWVDSGMKTFRTAEACEQWTDQANRANQSRQDGKTEYKCFKKTVPVWEPVR
jgi:hypothetical protein